jgi:hypothetical protein
MDLNIKFDNFSTVDMVILHFKGKLRDKQSIIPDRLLLMYLISKSTNSEFGITKLQKMAYLADYFLAKSGISTYNYKFYRWNYGPCSMELYADYDDLVDNGLVDSGIIKLTDKGQRLISSFEGFFKENRGILEKLDDIIYEHRGKSLTEIKNYVYDIELPTSSGSKRIEDIEKGIDLTPQLEDDIVKHKFELDASWIDTYFVLSNEKASASLRQGIEDVREGRVRVS